VSTLAQACGGLNACALSPFCGVWTCQVNVPAVGGSVVAVMVGCAPTPITILAGKPTLGAAGSDPTSTPQTGSVVEQVSLASPSNSPQ